LLTGAAAGDDFHAADLFGMGGEKKAFQRVKGGLGGFAVQIQRAGRSELAAAEAVPGGAVQAGGLQAGDEGWWWC
jgi:hypothetical protein